MVKSTIIARVADGLLLAASMDDEESEDLSRYKNQAKQLFKSLASNPHAEQRCSIESNHIVFHYLIEYGVCYLTLCERSYPKRLAFSYLEDLQREFQEKYGPEIGTVARPYAFVKFDTTLQKYKKQYQDTRAQRNLNRLNEDLQDVHKIMTRNINDVLGRGESLNRMSDLSSNLAAESKKYLKDAKNLNLFALYQKYGIPAILLLVFVFFIWLRFWWW
ncbi:hypothetical protein CXG81DRAFT_28254 [Caulochytrium protostelioides]|uniref:Protein transport protein SEC22 n=1 Tax=Caulochytrium protostelioides TaxID=1555241 RepID=A0A4P9WZQ5_9FUNG|nr:hypothetical protein CXG81DRAFT_28254 [Caulochytrium protostelioides]|eukprot:RKO98951.1 hypothetical protein CXG81DRAFT_28254 [Caulochytrium protostelioides]